MTSITGEHDDPKRLPAADGHETPMNGADRSSTIVGEREAAEMAEILIARHERWISTSELTESFFPARPSQSDRELTADIEQLDDCLRIVEQARREQIAANVTAGSRIAFSSGDASTAIDTFSASEDPPSDKGEAFTDLGDPVVHRIGRFQVLSELGRGGLGVVLLAYDPLLRRRIALKIPRPEALLTRNLRQRFQREAQAAARLTHPNIVPVFEVGEAGPVCYIAAAFVDGVTLAHWLNDKTRSLSEREAAALVADLAEAMHYAHGQGVLHRDLKPENVLLEPRDAMGDDGGGKSLSAWVAKIIDFGLAKLLDLAGNETRTGAIIGTPSYMSPEQAKGDRQVGPTADVYSLGAILYELLTGRPPFRGNSDAATLSQVVAQEAVAIRRSHPGVPRDLEAICLACLEKRPERRYVSAGDLAADLRRFLLGEPTRARPLSPGQMLVRWAQRRPAAAALSALVCVATMAAIGGAAFHTWRLDRALLLAEENGARAEQNEQSARQEEDRANLQLYAAQMRLAHLAVEQAQHERAARLLSMYDEGQPLANLRGLEWHVLQSQVKRMANTGSHSASFAFQHPSEVFSARFAPHGKWIATGSRDGCIRIWDLESRQLLHELKKHTSCVNQVRFSADGCLLASAGCDHKLILWLIPHEGPPEPIHTIDCGAPVRCVAFSPNGKQLVSGDDGGFVRCWDAQSGKLLRHKAMGALRVMSLSCSPDGRRLAWTVANLAGAAIGSVLWDYERWAPIALPDIAGNAVAFSPDGTRLAINEHFQRIRQFHVESGVELTSLESEAVDSFGVAWSPDSSRLATLEHKGILRVFNARSGKIEIAIDANHNNLHLEDIAFAPDGRHVASAARDGKVSITNITGHGVFSPSLAVSCMPASYQRATLDLDLRRLSLCSSVGFRQWNVETTELIVDHSWAPDPALASAEISSSSECMVYVHNQQATVVDVLSGTKRVVPEDIASGVVRALTFDGLPLVALLCASDETTSDRASVRLIDLAHFRELCRADDRRDDARTSYTGAVSPDGRYLLVPFPQGLELIEISTGERRRVPGGVGRGVNQLCFSPDGRQFVATEAGFDVKLWNVEPLAFKHTFNSRRPNAYAKFSADGRTLLVGRDETLSFWHTETGQEMMSLSLPCPLNDKSTFHVARNGHRLALIDMDDEHVRLHLWGAR